MKKLQTKFQEIWSTFLHFEIFCAKNSDFLPVRRATGATLKF